MLSHDLSGGGVACPAGTLMTVMEGVEVYEIEVLFDVKHPSVS